MDGKKPEVKEGEYLCQGCWKVSTDKSCWEWFNFRHLEPHLLCDDCVKKFEPDFSKLQENGL